MPNQRGFDRFYGIVWGVVDHFDPFSLCENDRPVESVPEDFYLTDAITEQSANFIHDATAAGRPFFLYVAYEAPHWPIQARPADIAKYRGKYDDGWDELRRRRFHRQTEMGLFDANMPLGNVITQGPPWPRLTDDKHAYLAAKMEVHAAMVDRVDQGIGRIVATLAIRPPPRQHGLCCSCPITARRPRSPEGRATTEMAARAMADLHCGTPSWNWRRTAQNLGAKRATRASAPLGPAPPTRRCGTGKWNPMKADAARRW